MCQWMRRVKEQKGRKEHPRIKYIVDTEKRVSTALQTSPGTRRGVSLAENGYPRWTRATDNNVHYSASEGASLAATGPPQEVRLGGLLSDDANIWWMIMPASRCHPAAEERRLRRATRQSDHAATPQQQQSWTRVAKVGPT